MKLPAVFVHAALESQSFKSGSAHLSTSAPEPPAPEPSGTYICAKTNMKEEQNEPKTKTRRSQSNAKHYPATRKKQKGEHSQNHELAKTKSKHATVPKESKRKKRARENKTDHTKSRKYKTENLLKDMEMF